MIDTQLTEAQRRAFEIRYSFEKAAEALTAFKLAWDEAVQQELLRLRQARIEARKKAKAEDRLYEKWRAEKDHASRAILEGSTE
jgi:hypothetical protein